MIFVNFKAYQQGTGKKAIDLILMLEEIALLNDVKIIPVLQASDIKEAVVSTKLEVWAQHVDAFEYGAHTGSILPEAVFEDGAVGTFLNHSEHKFENPEKLREANKRAISIGLKTLIFAADITELGRIIKLKPKPTYVSYEPPELVGSKTTSVAQAKPEIIERVVKLTVDKEIPLIVGAGIKSFEDVKKSLDLGAAGVAVASDVVTARDPRKEILDLVKGFR